MTVLRSKPLPRAAARGHLLVASAVVEQTLLHLRASRGQDGRHEGLAFWGGRVVDGDTVVLAAACGAFDHAWGRAIAPERTIGSVSRRLRANRLALVAQVHSHPGWDTRHSDGDDELVVMPFAGMFSLVVADYGDGGIGANSGMGLHQFQEGRWIWVTDADRALVILPPIMEA